MDISILYARLTLLFVDASARHQRNEKAKQAVVVAPIETPSVVNHLFIGKNGLGKKNRKVTGAPCIAPFYPNGNLTKGITREVKVQELKNQSKTRRKVEETEPKSPEKVEVKSDKSDFQQQELTVDSASVVKNTGDKEPDKEVCDKEVTKETDSSKSEGEQQKESQEESIDEISLIEFEKDKDKDNENTTEESCDNDNVIPAKDILQDQNTDCGIPQDQSSERKVELSHDTDACVEGEGDINDNTKVMEDPTQESQIITTPKVKKTLNTDAGAAKESCKEVQSPVRSKEVRSPVQSKEIQSPVRVVSSEPATPVRDIPSPESSGNLSSDGSSSNVRYATRHMSYSVQENSPSVLIDSDSDSSSQDSPVHDTNKKYFNPFPSRHISKNKAQNGIKLGLYSKSNVPAFEGGIQKKGGLPNIGRAQINACLHRQYMVGLKQSKR